MRLGLEDRGRFDAAQRLAAIALGLRIILPRPGERPPRSTDVGGSAPADPGPPAAGWFRPAYRAQDPAQDPAEADPAESSSTGTDHGWSNCTMTAGAMTLAFHTLGKTDVFAGNLRHAPGQPDMIGGTDLYDVAAAWNHYGAALQVRSGAGWEGVRADREAGRALILTGTGNVPGVATFDGGHAIAVLPEPHPDDPARWLQGDPLAGDWEWVAESDLRRWAERLEATINYARTAAHPGTTPGPGPEDVMYNVAPLTTHRDAVVLEGAILYRDSALEVRYSVTSKETAFGFAGSTGDAHVIINSGNTNYVRRSDVVRIVPNDRTFE